MQREWRGPWGVRASSKAGRAPGLMAVQKPWKTPVSGRPHWLNRGLELEVGVTGHTPSSPGPALLLPTPAALSMETGFIEARAHSSRHVRNGRER